MLLPFINGARVYSRVGGGLKIRHTVDLLTPRATAVTRHFANIVMASTSNAHKNHDAVMKQALALAEKSPPKPSNFRVGALLINLDSNEIIVGGFTLECPGNTHAEECCFIKLASEHQTTEELLSQSISRPHALYTTMEPCFKRLSGKLPCVERVIRQKSWIKKVFVGVQEPETFVGPNPGRKMLEEHGIEVHVVPGLEEQILQVATAGHAQDGS